MSLPTRPDSPQDDLSSTGIHARPRQLALPLCPSPLGVGRQKAGESDQRRRQGVIPLLVGVGEGEGVLLSLVEPPVDAGLEGLGGDGGEGRGGGEDEVAGDLYVVPGVAERVGAELLGREEGDDVGGEREVVDMSVFPQELRVGRRRIRVVLLSATLSRWI